jgi:tetratricopeptide (TPR) repeat protein
MKILKVFLLILLITGMIAPAVSAGSQADLETALDLMAAEENAAAALTLKNMLEKNPADMEAWYFLGRAYNRLNQFEKALDALIQAGILGFEGPDWEREIGIALLGRGLNRKALRALQKARPNDPEAAYFRGIAATRLGLREEAAQAFSVSAADPVFEEKARRFQAAASYPATRDKAWDVSLNLGLAYNDNLTLTPDFTPFPGGARPEGDFQYDLAATWAIAFYRSRDMEIGIRGFVNGAFPADIDNFDNITYRGAFFWRKSLQSLQLRLLAGFTGTNFDWDHYSSAWDLQTGLSLRETDWTWTDFDYTLKDVSFSATPPDPLEDRDSVFNILSIKQHFVFRSLLLENRNTSFSVGLSLPWRNADGGAYDGNGTSLHFSLSQALPMRFFIEANLSLDGMSYDDPHPRSPAGECREDDSVCVGARLTWNVMEDLSLNAGYRHTNNNSNIPEYFSFDQNVYTIGLTKRF